MSPVDPSESASAGATPYSSSSHYASWGRRVGAFILDGIVVIVLVWIVTKATGHKTPLDVIKFQTVNGQKKLIPIGHKLIFFNVTEGVIGFLYAVGFLASQWHATPFMRALSIRATAEKGGPPTRTVDHGVAASGRTELTLARSAGRAALVLCVALVSGIVGPAGLILFLLDMLWPLWDARNQTLHDKLAGTVVLVRPPGT